MMDWDTARHLEKETLWESLHDLVRSDLVLEAAPLFGNKQGTGDTPVFEYEKNGLLVTDVRVESEEQSDRLGRPKGRYITIYSDGLKEDDGGIHQETVKEVAGWIRTLLPEQVKTVFVAGLGNPDASPDALGPDTVRHVFVNRHLGDEICGMDIQVCAMAPGVMAQTGLETAGILTGVVENIRPDAVIVVDALAARSVTRLGTTIQLTDTGISPGSGIGNYRQEISQAVLGVPVIAIGIPMVVEAAAIIYETIESIRNALQQENMEQEAGFLRQLSREDQYNLFRELLEKKAHPLYVTVKDVDEIEKRLSFTLSEAINQAFLF